jgi:hypothetical protein
MMSGSICARMHTADAPDVEVSIEIEHSTLYNKDLAPVPSARRTWRVGSFAALWISMSACIPTYMLASSLIGGGMNWSQAIITIFLGNLIVVVPMILKRRFSESRRPHPMQDPGGSLEKAINDEQLILAPLRDVADRIIDTGQFNAHELRSFLKASFGEHHTATALNVHLPEPRVSNSSLIGR